MLSLLQATTRQHPLLFSDFKLFEIRNEEQETAPKNYSNQTIT